MAKFFAGKLLLGGLGLTLFTKAAISFPLFPVPEAISRYDLAATTAAQIDPSDPSDIPPLVRGLGASKETCTAPEEVMLSLQRERELLEEQKRKVEARKSEIALAREKLDIEKQALIGLKSSLEKLLAKVDAAKTGDLKRLVEFYQNMKPTDAARIMDDMDIETTIMILGAMKPRVAAPILAKMSPVRTRAVSKIILERSQLPGDQDLNGIRLN